MKKFKFYVFHDFKPLGFIKKLRSKKVKRKYYSTLRANLYKISKSQASELFIVMKSRSKNLPSMHEESNFVKSKAVGHVLKMESKFSKSKGVSLCI